MEGAHSLTPQVNYLPLLSNHTSTGKEGVKKGERKEEHVCDEQWRPDFRSRNLLPSFLVREKN